MPLALPGGEAHAWAVISVLRTTTPQLFDPAPLTMLALSKLTTATAGARAGFAAAPFLAVAWCAGLRGAMMDVFDPGLMAASRLCGVFAGKRFFAPGEYC
jgi:hypothetical protein